MWNVTLHTHPCENHSFLQVPQAQFTASTGVVLLIRAASTMIGMLMRGEASAANKMMSRVDILLVNVAEGLEELYVGEVSGYPPSLAIMLWCWCGGICCCPWASAGVVVLASVAGGMPMVGSCVLGELFAELLEDELKIAL